MLRTVEAVVEKDGSLRLLEDVELREGERALVTILGDDADATDDALLSEPALAAEWEREEEEEAWRHLQP
jgi:predicted DNA-binding antitoxin AbrB/MazE fold protein